jgi:TRAP-type uncharacterized transport system substrate-binding protein
MATSEAPALMSTFLNFPQFSVQLKDIGDSEKRLVALQQESIDVTTSVADVAYLGFNGQLPNRSQRLDKIRGIALLHPAAAHLLVGPATDLRHGFRGMRVVFGDPIGSNAALGERLFASMEIPISEIRGEYLPRERTLGGHWRTGN